MGTGEHAPHISQNFCYINLSFYSLEIVSVPCTHQPIKEPLELWHCPLSYCPEDGMGPRFIQPQRENWDSEPGLGVSFWSWSLRRENEELKLVPRDNYFQWENISYCKTFLFLRGKRAVNNGEYVSRRGTNWPGKLSASINNFQRFCRDLWTLIVDTKRKCMEKNIVQKVRT